MRSAVRCSPQVDVCTEATRSRRPTCQLLLQWGLAGLMLAFATANSFAATPAQQRCERMAQNLAQQEQRGLDPAQLNRAQKQYERMCRGVSAGGSDRHPRPAEHQRSAIQAPLASQPSPAPTASFTRTQTEDNFADWDRELNAQCDNRTPDGRTRCAQTKIDRAVQEGRLSAAEKVTPTATLCALDSDHPRCRAASAPPRQQQFSMWSAVEYARCARESTPGQNRDHCARTLVEQASQLGLISAGAVERCRAQWSQGGKDQTEPLSVFLCLEGSARQEEMMTSRILRSKPAHASGNSIAPNGYRQPQAVTNIYAGRFSEVPTQASLGGPYFIQALNELGSSCPELGVIAVQIQLAQQMARSQRELIERAARGQASREGTQAAVAAIVVGLALMEDCDGKSSHEERQQCESRKEDLMTQPESRDAVHDMALLVKRHACTSLETRRFTDNLGRWLMTPPALRSPLAWAQGLPQQALYQAMFENCRRQAGDGAADAWCGCYVEQFSRTRPGTRAHPAAHAATAHETAFVGDSEAWFVPSDLSTCDAHLDRLKAWRRTQSPEATTACLMGQTPVTESVVPGLQACRYRTAWGEIELRSTQCQPRLTARYWGDQVIQCP